MKDKSDKNTMDFLGDPVVPKDIIIYKVSGFILYGELYKKFRAVYGMEEISRLVARGVYPGHAMAKIPLLTVRLYLGEEYVKKILIKKS